MTPLKTKQQMAMEIGVSLSTLKRRLKKAEVNIPRGLLTIQQQKLISEVFGLAPSVSRNEPK